MAGVVSGYIIRPPNTMLYLVRWSDGNEAEHYDMELSVDKEYRPDES